jgi:hypothetical protein
VPPAALDEATYHAELLESTGRIAEILTSAEPALRVTTCPAWTLSDLALHVGRGHRWAQRITETRAQRPIDRSAVDLGLPATPSGYGAWLCSGAAAFFAAVQSATTRTPVCGAGPTTTASASGYAGSPTTQSSTESTLSSR